MTNVAVGIWKFSGTRIQIDIESQIDIQINCPRIERTIIGNIYLSLQACL